MLTVWCVWWRDPANPDKYDEYSVQRLQRTVAENLSIPHEFICISKEHVHNVATFPPPVDWPGWWQKIGLFQPGVATPLNLYLDLDVVITGDLTEMVEAHRESGLAMPLNWAQSGHGGCQSSVMIWKQSRNTLPIWKEFDTAWIHWPPTPPWRFYGDQEVITYFRDTGKITVDPINAAWIKSYKYHCRDGLPLDTRVCVFHGDPKPEQVKASWFRW